MINLQEFEKKVFSQNGEDGIIEKLNELLNKNPKYFVEFGVEDAKECNTRYLCYHDKLWSGLLMDSQHENTNINLQKEFITKDNILSLFEKHQVPKHINLLSIDIDFNDYYILKEILQHYTMDIIICEYNASLTSKEDKVVVYNENHYWDYTNYFGASLLAYTKLCNNFNYSLIYCEENGVNCFFLHNNFVKKLKEEQNLEFLNINNVDLLYKTPKYGFTKNGHPMDTQNRQYLSSDIAYFFHLK